MHLNLNTSSIIPYNFTIYNMQKIILLPLLAFLSLTVKAQIKDTVGLNLPIVDGKILYEGIVDIPDKTKNDLYQNAQQWFVDYFKSSKDVIQNQDKDNGIVVGKGMLDFNARVGLGMSMVQHDKLTIKIVCKDNKYKYSVYDMILYPPEGNEKYSTPFDNLYGKLIGTVKIGGSKSAVKDILKKNDIEVRKMIESIKLAMVKKSDNF